MPQLPQPWYTRERGLKTSLDTRYLEFQAYSGYLKSLLKTQPSPGHNFLLLTTARSGSNLLRTLINCHPQVICEGEILLNFNRYLYWRRVIWLEAYIKGRRFEHAKKCYGCDIKIYQLDDHFLNVKATDAQALLYRLIEQGWKIIWLERKNTVRQALSILRAEAFQRWTLKVGVNDNTPPLEIDSDSLKRKIHWHEKTTSKGRHWLRSLPHLEVVYELDLLNSDKHQVALDRIFDYLELSSAPVTAGFQKIGSADLSRDISNLEEIRQALRGTKHEAFLDMP